MIDLTNTLFVVTAWPDNRWPIELFAWIYGLIGGHDNWLERQCKSVKVPNIVCARNTAMEYCLNSNFDDYIFIDRDIRPTAESMAFLDLTSDIKCCDVKLHNPLAWSKPTSFHEPFWSTSRNVLIGIDPPWFEHQYNEDKTKSLGCICKSFEAKALAAGFTIAHGGWAEHDLDGSWCS